MDVEVHVRWREVVGADGRRSVPQQHGEARRHGIQRAVRVNAVAHVYLVPGVRGSILRKLTRRAGHLCHFGRAGITVMHVGHGDLKREQAEAEEREERDGAAHGVRTIHEVALRIVVRRIMYA